MSPVGDGAKRPRIALSASTGQRYGTMRRVGLLGGSFNPPHICHLLASVYALETAGLDAVWWLPVHVHAFAKDSQLAPWDDRLAMCRAATKDWPGVDVDPIEASLGPTSYTIETIEALQIAHPATSFVWIAGADLLDELARWHRWPELGEVLEFLIIGRGDEALALPDGGTFDVRPFALPDVSSTAIRTLLRAGDFDAARALVPAGVGAWLADHPDLYR